jgi:prolyl 4-hydroxylase
MTSCFSLLLPLLVLLSPARAEEVEPTYGVDVSWPMHHEKVSTNYPWLPHNLDKSLPTPPEYEGMVLQPLGDIQARSDAYIEGCYKHYQNLKQRGSSCHNFEKQRIAMNLRQPRGMQNYTTLGYTKIRAPETAIKLIQHFWEANKEKKKIEKWGVGAFIGGCFAACV